MNALFEPLFPDALAWVGIGSILTFSILLWRGIADKNLLSRFGRWTLGLLVVFVSILILLNTRNGNWYSLPVLLIFCSFMITGGLLMINSCSDKE